MVVLEPPKKDRSGLCAFAADRLAKRDDSLDLDFHALRHHDPRRDFSDVSSVSPTKMESAPAKKQRACL
ncbi:hypothetical protein B5P45_19430 [Phyllobacterium zundukense]|uniref:Uncharacterized protein n=1 Tax=Phyllobacterium zundukense TaxID=1867719 RepID=A0A2N9VUT1_9HYPH|nr:hypothetical protein BLM14_26650 [Phyllobacterium zundukense]PIO43249.1 hypothetical protein B5P45_19430 [Phyllobacterium zundukense]